MSVLCEVDGAVLMFYRACENIFICCGGSANVFIIKKYRGELRLGHVRNESWLNKIGSSIIWEKS